ncbi:MAG: YqgE/AlgH family protein [Flavobacteriales bacterium]|nr:YqgE/AlgH family protein [Flavobacteriales bacterium]MCC6939372.1 YqgE/AlgH family protein [Flavobacteriales bacterium]
MSESILDLDPNNKLDPGPGRLLVSGPYLADPYFRRTVVLLCEHNDEGSFGFVLNRKMELGINDLMENMPPIGSPVGIGGPVQSSELYYLHTLGEHIQGSRLVIDGVYMGGDYEQLRSVLATDPRLAKHVRFFVGYSGWGADQLNKELEQRSWWVTQATKRKVMGSKVKDLWGDTLRSMGKSYAPLANFPEDPTLN